MKKLLGFIGIILFVNFLIPVIIFLKINNDLFNREYGQVGGGIILVPNFFIISIHFFIALTLILVNYCGNGYLKHVKIYKYSAVSNGIFNYIWLLNVFTSHRYTLLSYLFVAGYFIIDIGISFYAFKGPKNKALD